MSNEENSNQRKASEGEYRVGVNFNPGGHEQVDEIKKLTAHLIDYIGVHGLDERCTRLAKTAFEDAAMWAVKSVTKDSQQTSTTDC